MVKRIDISGQKFGKLTALSYNAEIRKWRCQCDCGSPQKEVAYKHLKSGATRSCGCSKSVGPRKIDLAGRKLGRLTVIKEVGRRGSRFYGDVNAIAAKLKILVVASCSQARQNHAAVYSVSHNFPTCAIATMINV